MQNDATARQVRASDPNASTWLSANAGSGKTRVLTDRVARLLLQDVEPQRILCLTYTKSAASEMQNRLFKTLGQWAMKPDADLRQALAELGDDGRDDQHLARARRLFARAIETPGGLRIQTIHSFCATLLRRFPLEAAVSPRFGELDDRTGRLLRRDILEEMCMGPEATLVTAVAQQFSGADFGTLVEQIVTRRDGFRQASDPSALFGVNPQASFASLLVDAFAGDEPQWIGTVLGVLAKGSTNDTKAQARLAALDLSAPDLTTLIELERLFLFGEDAKEPFGAKIGTFPTKPSRIALGPDLARLESLMQRVEAARPQRIALQAATRTAALQHFAQAFLALYEARKAQRNFLDFDDLIAKATRLVTNPSVAAWVLYKLDGGIDHVLVDEAQDTSPGQWRVIELLTAEFTAGESAHLGDRTIFVVGDQKQSIYSFQGADVAAFDAKHAAFEHRFKTVEKPFQSLKLAHSFRSSPAILGFVDAALRDLDASALGPDIAHIAFQSALPGRVDLWPLIEGEKDPVDKNFEDPVDLIRPTHHAAQLAERIATEMDGMLRDGVQIVTRDGARPVHPGDFLILVQRRSALFTEIIRACKKRGLPIAGADRLKLGAELAVKDLLALLAFLDTPEDSLSLAAVMRSPILGLSEPDLYRLAHGRTGTLWDSLRLHQTRFPAAVDLLTDLRGQVDFLRPFDLLERVLIRHDGRRRLVTRLGDEAEDGIDELLNQALAYERGEIPSLTGFLIWLDADQIDIKRQAEASGHRIRVMTVHGAKGLESEIVILPDTADHQGNDRDEIYVTPDGTALWKTATAESPPLIASLRTAKSRREAEENLRLLYVAMTRARTWLIICGAGTVSQPASWYAIASAGMAQVGALPVGQCLRHEFGVWPDANPMTPATTTVRRAPLNLPAPPDPLPPVAVLNPSDLGGAKALPGEPVSEAQSGIARGIAIHALLQHLPQYPQADWPHICAFLVPDETLCADVTEEAHAILTKPSLALLFSPGTLAEVAITGALRDRRVYGAVDRLIITDTTILAVDYKSNWIIPTTADQVPEGLLRQLGAYHHLLSALYPTHRIDTAILWTRSATLMPIDAAIVRAALQRAATPEDTAP
ncbi:MAG: double-strand break repair helicase AddA [Candidatus Saccharibacteria bacterium]|nr:double-strand break repair helicase AddA [Pseudorhodobacter sp.]